MPFSRSGMIDLGPWPGYQVCCGNELSSQTPQARRLLGPIDCPFMKDSPQNEGKFPTYAKYLEIFFLPIMFSSNLSCDFPDLLHLEWKQQTPCQPLEIDVLLKNSRRRWQTICGIPNNASCN